MDHRRATSGKKNRLMRQDDSGTFYRDIAFVPSGTLAMNMETLTRAGTREEAADVREFYKTVLAMPRTAAPQKKKRQKQQQRTPASSDTLEEAASKPTAIVVHETLEQIAPRSSSAPPSPSRVSPSSPSSAPASPFTNNIKSISAASTTTIPIVVSTPEAADVVRRNWQASQGSTRVVAEGHVLCESCQIEVREDDLDRHRRGTAHLMSEESPIKPLDTLTLGHSNKGFRMLVNSGWDYEKGLGAEGQGARHPVATRLKHDRLTLGAAGVGKKLVTHTFEEIEQSRTKPTAKSNRRVPLSLEDYRRKAEKERRERVRMMNYMKK
ncbi:G patch domain and ankyrin repeat-containing protein 1 [Mortierella claussenii]|nr:G patch domain and ankyrin repeat-containing protein 1 [Mortierella claussenii]